MHISFVALFRIFLLSITVRKLAPPESKRRFAVDSGTLAAASVPTELKVHILFYRFFRHTLKAEHE